MQQTFGIVLIALCLQFADVFGQQNAVGSNSSGFKCPIPGDDIAIYPDPATCSHFYMCEHEGSADEKATKLQCPQGLLFSSTDKICDWARNVDCKDGGRPDLDEGSGVEVRVGSSMEGDTKENIMSKEAEAGPVEEEGFIPVTTPGPASSTQGPTFTRSIPSTNTKSIFIPSTNTKSIFEESTNTKSITEPEPAFKCPQDNPSKTMYRDPVDCGYYFHCAHVGTEFETAYKHRCPSGLAFNEELKYCDWPSNVPGCGGSQHQLKRRRKRRKLL